MKHGCPRQQQNNLSQNEIDTRDTKRDLIQATGVLIPLLYFFPKIQEIFFYILSVVWNKWEKNHGFVCRTLKKNTHQQSVRYITQQLPLKYLKYIQIII